MIEKQILIKIIYSDLYIIELPKNSVADSVALNISGSVLLLISGSGFYDYMEYLDNFKSLLLCFHTFGVRRSINVLNPENQPGGSGVLGLTEDV